MSSWWDVIWGSVVPGGAVVTGGEAVADAVTGGGGVISNISDTVSFGKLVWLNLSDYRMWRSLGWLLLGILLMILGFVVWNRKAIAGAAKLAAL